jgi:hypothetical protein
VAFLPESQPHGAVVLVEAVVLVVSLLATWAYDTEVKRIEEEPR